MLCLFRPGRWSSSTTIAIVGSGDGLLDLVFADGGPDLERVFIAGPFTLLGTDGGVLAALRDAVAGLGVGGLEAVLIRCAFDLEALSFFAERRGVGLGTCTGAVNLGVAGLLSFTLGDGGVSSAACVGVSTLGTPIVSRMRSTLGTPSAF